MSLTYNLFPFVTAESGSDLEKSLYCPKSTTLPKGVVPLLSQQCERLRQALIGAALPEDTMPLPADFPDPTTLNFRTQKAFGKYVVNMSENAEVCFQPSLDGKDDMLNINGYGTGIYWDRNCQVVCIFPTCYEDTHAVFQFDITESVADPTKPKRRSYSIYAPVKDFWIISTKKDAPYISMDTYEIQEKGEKLQLVFVCAAASNDDDDPTTQATAVCGDYDDDDPEDGDYEPGKDEAEAQADALDEAEEAEEPEAVEEAEEAEEPEAVGEVEPAKEAEAVEEAEPAKETSEPTEVEVLTEVQVPEAGEGENGDTPA